MLHMGSSSSATLQRAIDPPRKTHAPQLIVCAETGKKTRKLLDDGHKDSSGLGLIPSTFPGLLRHQARSIPDAIAIDSHQCQWTYSQLETEVLAIAEALGNLGVGSAHRVGLCSHLSPWAVASILASMMLGAAVVPVDPLHPLGRRLTMLREANVGLVMVEESSFTDELQRNGLPTLDVSSINASPNMFPPELSHSPLPKANSDAFVAYTSGSSGTPKGIVQTHDALVTMSKAIADSLCVEPASRVAQLHPYIFDVSMMEIGMCLVTGAVLCVAKKKDMMLPVPGEVGNQLTKLAVSHVTLSSTMLDTMDPSEVPTVRVLSVMGEPLGRRSAQKWAAHQRLNFHQLWGCTEATILQSITPPITRDSQPQNIGRAIAGVCRLWIVDPEDCNRLLPDGEPGELMVESRCLAKGYLNRPHETAQVFLPSAKWKDISSRSRLYRSGDLARREVDGSIAFLGRRDDQMNYHGERIELGEIDFQIDRLRPPAITCFSHFDAPTQRVVGFVCGPTAVTDDESDGSELLLPWDRAAVSPLAMTALTRGLLSGGDLPAYMVPHFWIPLSRRPVTVSGKTDRSRLRRLMQGLSAAQWADREVLAMDSSG